jgi:hypothetical protein
MEHNKIIRHTPPTKYDSAPFATICQVVVGDEDYHIYIQLSDTVEARWEPVGYLLEAAFSDLVEDHEFIHELLVLITSEERSYKNIAHTLNKK